MIINNILKIIINILVTSILLYTTSLNELNYGLYKLFYPFKYIKIDANITLFIAVPTKFYMLIKILLIIYECIRLTLSDYRQR